MVVSKESGKISTLEEILSKEDLAKLKSIWKDLKLSLVEEEPNSMTITIPKITEEQQKTIGAMNDEELMQIAAGKLVKWTHNQTCAPIVWC